ncbi:response regulator transcription factor [Cupriavidus consociatus]|uniref:response regulator transcription factor n=1 Tax=Cupriavidus consociatus TaxID=2821357 RepID=UPI001AE60064|nr:MULTISPECIES: response regulator transcription factor [unclassified Cupriavidus]MBP0620689.1 response regulator transcription factor [Cupriavidus sp. LEh25]MDK2657349.1 response regulator transcription factor [Cupriavidus sp. LEh21]
MKVLLIESHALMRVALRRTLEEFDAVGEVVTAEPAELAGRRAAGEAIALIVLGLPDDPEAAWHLLCQVGRTWPAARLLVLSDIAPRNWVDDKVTAGVVGCLPKSVPPDVLEAAIRLVASGYQVSLGPFSQRPGIAPASHDGPRQGSANGSVERRAKGSTVAATETVAGSRSPGEAHVLGLTPRQYEILVLLARGYPAKTISRQLNVSVATVKCHCNALYKALGVRSKGEAVHVALQRGARLGQAMGPGPGQAVPKPVASPPRPGPRAAVADPEDCAAL